MRARLRPGRGIAHVLVFALAPALVAACLGDEAPQPSASPTFVPDVTPAAVSYALYTTVWYAGFEVTFGTAVATLDSKGGPVTVDTQFFNPGTDPATLDAPIRLTAGGQAYDLSRDTKVPEVPAGEQVPVQLTFDVEGRGSVDDGIIRIGRAADHEALIPLHSGSTSTLTLQPIASRASGSQSAADLKLTLRGWILRWDLPDWGLELPFGRAVVTVSYDAAYTGDFAGGFAFTGDNIALRLPDGTIVTPRPDGRSQSIALINAAQTVTGMSSRFEIPTGLSGTFALLVKNGSTKKLLKFVVRG